MFGFEPIYYTDGANWSKNFRELAQHSTLEIDEEAMHEYLHHQYLVGNKTLIKGIYKLPPACTLVTSESCFEVKRYWDVGDNRIELKDIHIKDLDGLIGNSICDAIGSENEVGVFLSGGLDSSLVAAIASKHVKHGKLHAFIMSFDTFSEAKWANIVSEHLGMIPHNVQLTAKDVVRILPDIIRDFDEPMGDAAGINNWVLARQASEYIKVVLSGDGADEIFAGYPWHKLGIKLDALQWAREPVKLVASMIPHKGVLNSLCGLIYQRAGVFGAENKQIYMESAMSDAEVKWLTGKCLSDGYNQFHRPNVSEL